MPNWCDNSLTVYGLREDVDRFVAQATSPDDHKDPNHPLAFDCILPLKWEQQDYTWWAYEAHREPQCHFGPKAYSRYLFRTRWSPPGSFLDQVAPTFPELTFVLRYWEFLAGFTGMAVWDDGELIYQAHRPPIEGVDFYYTQGRVMPADEVLDSLEEF